MSPRIVLAVAIAVIPWGTPASGADEAPLSAEELARIESQCLESRRQIRSAELEVSWKLTRWVDGQPTPEVQGSEYHLISGSRQLLKTKQSMGGDRPPLYQVQGWNCIEPDMFLEYAEEGERRSPATFTKVNPNKSPVDAPRQKPNPMLIGMVWNQYLLYGDESLTSMVGRPERHEVTARRTKLGERDVILVSYQFDPPAPEKPRRIGRYWLSPAEGNQVVKSEFESAKSLIRAEYELQQDPGGKHWFPRSFRIEEFRDKAPYARHTGEIHLISLNDPIPAERFDVENIGLPVGTPVWNRPGEDRPGVPQGKTPEKSAANPTEPARMPAEEPEDRRTQPVLWIAGGLGLIGLLACGILYVRKRQRAARGG